MQAKEQGSDTSFEEFINQQSGALLESLDDLANNDFESFGFAYQFFDETDMWTDLSLVAEAYGSEIIPDVIDFADMMESEFVTISVESGSKLHLAHRIFNWLHEYSPTNVALDWKRRAVASTEDWLRTTLDEAVANGLSPTVSYQVGYYWGLVQTADTLSDLADGRVLAEMVSTIYTTVVDASRGDTEAQKALTAMIPVYGTYLVGGEALADYDDGKYFDSGIKTMQVVTDGIETLAGGGAVLGVARDAMVRRGRRQLNKVNEVRLQNDDLTELKNRSRHGTGNHGEELARKYLDVLGYNRIVKLQNGRGNGIDLVGTSPDGHVVFIEVKASKDISGLKLSESQQEFEKFVEDRLDSIRLRKKPYGNVDAATVSDAKHYYDLLEDGAPVHYRAIAIDGAFDEWPTIRVYGFD